jgi:hypothetical protein
MVNNDLFPIQPRPGTHGERTNAPGSELGEIFILAFTFPTAYEHAWLFDCQDLLNSVKAVSVRWKSLRMRGLEQKCIENSSSMNTPRSLASKPDELVNGLQGGTASNEILKVIGIIVVRPRSI